MVLAIIGSTGLVGTEIKKVLEEKKIKSIKKVLFVASKKNVGKKINYKNKTHRIISIEEAIKNKPNYALFASGSETSLKHAKEFKKNNTTVIDNSSAFRMKKNIKLIVPEINGQTLTKKDKIIANPNCSTIQLIMAIGPIHKKIGIKRIIVSTYQSVLGTGSLAVKQLKSEEKNKNTKTQIYDKNIHRNIIPKCDVFEKNEYTKEEEKIIKETNKILESNIRITTTAVRVPTLGGHGESVNIELKKSTTTNEIKKILKKQKGIVLDPPEKYTTPKEVRGKNEVFVSRLRKDFSQKNSFNMWIVADPLRKGAATNAIQILELLINNNK
tara:strand:+ start:428 stop:1408 length:981 start_codon:yes stop_codon:yes gene_type:complete